MKLRFQLLLVSSLLLILPLGAWQYLKAVDLALRSAHEQALLDSVSVLTKKLAQEPKLFDDPFVSGELFATEVSAKNSFFSYPLSRAPRIDGYADGDEWQNWQLQHYNFLQQNTSQKNNIHLKLGVYQQKIYFYLSVEDYDLYYFNPSLPVSESVDRVELKLFSGRNRDSQTYYLQTSAPSEFVAYYRNEFNQLVPQHQIQGVWRENSRGYQLEFVVDQLLLAQGFSLSVIDRQGEDTQHYKLSEGIQHIIKPSKEISDFVQSFYESSLRVKVINPQGWLVAANSEALKTEVESGIENNTPWFVEWFYRQLLNSEDLPSRQLNPYHSYENYKEILASLTSSPAIQWYKYRSQTSDGFRPQLFEGKTLASASSPIYYRQQLLGFVVVEKTTDQLIALTSSAFGRLFVYTIGSFLLVGLVLLLYASWLSLRISRLNQAANNVVDEKGYIQLNDNTWPELKRQDEIGELSRGYKKLLLQLSSYHDYLRSLSSKLSHELRTPIAVIKSSLENIDQVDTPELKQQYSLRAQQGIERLSKILTAMSAANSVEQSIYDAVLENVDLNDFLPKLLASYRDIYPENCFEFFSDNQEILVNISQEFFVQMLDKLMDNAQSFSPKEKPIILRLSKNKTRGVIEIENTGQRLPENMQYSLFDSMVSLRSNKAPEATHLGLGLYVVKLIVDFHRGGVTAKNKSDETGVIFSVSLPLF